MKTLIISTEGQTALQPHLANFGLYAKPIILGNARRKGTGGWNKMGQFIAEIKLLLNNPAERNSYVTTMFDFADIRDDFSDYQNMVNEPDKYIAVTRAESVLKASVPNERFIPYFQLPQFETFVFTKPEVLLHEFPEGDSAIKELEHQRADYKDGNQELINSTNKPSNRIAEALIVSPVSFKGKPIANITADIELPFLRASCKHFNVWLSTLELLNLGNAMI